MDGHAALRSVARTVARLRFGAEVGEPLLLFGARPGVAAATSASGVFLAAASAAIAVTAAAVSPSTATATVVPAGTSSPLGAPAVEDSLERGPAASGLTQRDHGTQGEKEEATHRSLTIACRRPLGASRNRGRLGARGLIRKSRLRMSAPAVRSRTPTYRASVPTTRDHIVMSIRATAPSGDLATGGTSI